MKGIPPASETTSGRLATANSARISDAVIPAVRAAYRPVKASSTTPVRGPASCSGAPAMTAGYRRRGGVPVRRDGPSAFRWLPDGLPPRRGGSYPAGVIVPSPASASWRAVAYGLAGLLLGVVGGWLAGLLRAPRSAS